MGGLKTKPGRGRKASLNQDQASSIEAVKANRQRWQTAQAEWALASGKSDTFRRFGLADATNG